MPIRKAVFPVAGLGTRFLPATKAIPKEMLPLVDRPAIEYVVEEAVNSGIEVIILVTGRGKGAIEDHFDKAYELERTLEDRKKDDLLESVRRATDMARMCYVRQKEPLGLGHAVLAAKDLVGDEPFAVFLGDDLVHSTVPCMRQMIEVREAHGGSVVAVEQVERARVSDYGVVAPSGVTKDAQGRDSIHAVSDLVEKPEVSKAPSNLAIIGRYIFSPAIFDELERTKPDHKGEIQLTHAMRSLLAKEPLHAYEFSGIRYDTGSKIGFLKATVEYAMRDEKLGTDFREYLRSLDLA